MRRVLSLSLLATSFLVIAVSFAYLAEAEDRQVEAGPLVYTIQANDGYGTGDCLAKGAECGRAIADAWCRTRGLGQAASYGRSVAEDITGAVRANPVKSSASHVTITCTP
jgi:hypothetical protein